MNPREKRRYMCVLKGEKGKGKIMSSYYNFKNDYKKNPM